MQDTPQLCMPAGCNLLPDLAHIPPALPTRTTAGKLGECQFLSRLGYDIDRTAIAMLGCLFARGSDVDCIATRTSAFLPLSCQVRELP